ncbi:MAG: Maf family protein [Candidatus Omnitrophota bacterium]
MRRDIILASASVRRAEILSSCGIKFRVVPSGAEEDLEQHRPVYETVQINALRKAETVASGEELSIVVAADTLVVYGGKVIGKPGSEEDARMLLKNFSGGEVEVCTGLCVIDSLKGAKAVGFEKSSLNVASLTDREVDRYFRLLGPYDKAGGFSIEGVGSIIFDNIRGSYFNILGLPMMKLKELFSEAGLDLLDYVEEA